MPGILPIENQCFKSPTLAGSGFQAKINAIISNKTLLLQPLPLTTKPNLALQSQDPLTKSSQFIGRIKRMTAALRHSDDRIPLEDLG